MSSGGSGSLSNNIMGPFSTEYEPLHFYVSITDARLRSGLGALSSGSTVGLQQPVRLPFSPALASFSSPLFLASLKLSASPASHLPRSTLAAVRTLHSSLNASAPDSHGMERHLLLADACRHAVQRLVFHRHLDRVGRRRVGVRDCRSPGMSRTLTTSQTPGVYDGAEEKEARAL
jgi:hypothetical protein